MLYVDRRWNGNHGIARFGREVIKRLDIPFRNLDSRIGPTSPFDLLTPQRLLFGARDILFSPGFNAGFSMGRQLVTIHDLIHLQISGESSLLKRIYYDRVLKPTVIDAGLVFTVSETTREHILNWLDEESVTVLNVGNGVGDEFMQARQNPVASATDFVFVGNSKPHKNLETILAGLRLRPRYSLSIISSDVSGVSQLVQRHGIGGQVTVTSNISDIELANVYATSAALLFPSVMEGFGLPAAEARKSGTLVAYWKGCSTIDEIVDGHGMAVEDAHDPVQWARTMDECSDLSRLGVQAPSREWQSRYDWGHVASKVSEGLSAYQGGLAQHIGGA